MSDIFRKQAQLKEIRAAGICFDVRTIPSGTKEKTDALCMSLEHVSGEAVNVYIPYKRRKSGELEYGEIFATRREPGFFLEVPS